MKSDKDCTELVCDNITCNNVTSVVISWDDYSVIGLYFVEFLILLVILLCIIFLTRNRNSPLVETCFSTPDYIILTILGIFCILPLAHLGQFSTMRCSVLWPIVNIIYVFYTTLVLSKTVFLQNLLSCQTPTDHGGRKVLFAVFMTILHVSIIIASLIIGPFPTCKRYVCPTREVMTQCDPRGNLGIIVTTTLNWTTMLFLFIVNLTERVNNTNDPRRTKKQVWISFILLTSFSFLSITSFSKLRLQFYTAVTYLYYVIYLINPVISLVSFLPSIYPIYRCLREQERCQRAIQRIPDSRLRTTANNILFNNSLPSLCTNSHRGQCTTREPEHVSPERTGSVPRRTSIDPRRTLSWSEASAASSLSYPSSLAEPDRDQFVRVVSRLRKSLDLAYFIESRTSFCDNATSLHPGWSRTEGDNRSSVTLSVAEEQFCENNEDEVFTNEELTQMKTFVQNLQSTNV